MAVFLAAGSSQYFEDDAAAVITPPLSVSLIAKANDLTNFRVPFQMGDKDGPANFHRLVFNGAIGGDPVQWTSRRQGAAGTGTAATTNPYSVDTWHVLTGVEITTSSRAVYIDGGSKGTNATNVVLVESPDRTSIGRAGDSSPSNYHDGSIFSCAIWNAALDDDDAAQLGLWYSPLKIKRANLLRYWVLWDETTLVDLITGQTLTAFNSPTKDKTNPPVILDTGGGHPTFLPGPTTAARKRSMAGKVALEVAAGDKVRLRVGRTVGGSMLRTVADGSGVSATFKKGSA